MTRAGIDHDAATRDDHAAKSRPRAAVHGAELEAGERLGKFTVVRRIGAGGMGVVYEARDELLDRRVALKLLALEAGDDSPRAQRILREARAAASFSHPNVVAIHEVGAGAAGPYIAMEYVDGRSLRDWLADSPRSWREVVGVFVQAAEGLAAAHDAGLVHCDVKPDNILIGVDRVRVADFGVARAAGGEEGESATIAGTPRYMAPEHRAGQPVPASDQLGLCASLFEALTGELPDPPGPYVFADDAPAPAWLRRAVLRGLAAEPERRHADVRALADELRQARGRGRRRGPKAAVALALAGAAVAAGAVALWPGSAHRTGEGAATAATAAAATAPEPIRVGPPRLLTDDGGCAYSPAFADAATVVYDLSRADDVDLYRVAVRGGDPVRLTTATTWEWRPTPGRRPGEILYLLHDMSSAHGAAEIEFLDLASGERESMALDTASLALADGAIYYVDGISTHVRRRIGERDDILMTIDAMTAQIAVAPGGALALVGAVPGQAPQLCLAAAGDDHPSCLPGGVRAGRPAFSPDGATLWFAGYDGLHRRDLASGRDQLAVPQANGRGGLAVAPDGRWLAWSDCSPRGNLVDLSSSPPRVIRDDANVREPTTGPGGRLAWTQDGHRGAIMVQQPDGTVAQVSDPSLEIVTGPSFSPDGTLVAFAASGAQTGIYVTSSAGGRPTTHVSDGEQDIMPFWTRDGRIAFTRFDEQRIAHLYLVAREGGPPVLTLANRQALSANLATGELLLFTMAGTMTWWDPVTGRERPGPRWTGKRDWAGAAISPNGEWMVLQGGAGEEIWRLRLRGGAEPEHVVDLPANYTVGAATIDDGGHVLAVPREERGEIWAAPIGEGAGATR